MTKHKDTLIILTPGFAASETDTTCLPMQQQLVKSLRQYQPDLTVKIISLQYPYHTNPYNWFTIEIIPFNGRNKGGLPRLWLRKKIISFLHRIHRDTPVTGLLSFWYGECSAIADLFARKNGLPHFSWISGQDAKKENNYPQKIKLPAASLIALSDFLQDEFERNHKTRPLHVIPPGIPDPHSPEVCRKDIDLLAAGSLIPLKRYELFVEAVAAIKNRYPGVRATLIGKGPEMKRLQELIDATGLEKTIRLTGELPYNEVLTWMRRSKILLHPSSYEGFSGVCMEALAEAAHVISFCQPMKKAIEQWHIVNTKEEMINKAIAILQNPQTDYKKTCPYTMKQTAQEIIHLFKKR